MKIMILMLIFLVLPSEGKRHNDNTFEYCDFYREIGLKNIYGEVIFSIKELSYVDKNELDDYYSGFCYCGSQCIDRDINVYLLRYNMKKVNRKIS